MVRTKNTARKQHFGLPKARFPVIPTGHSERDLHYHAQLQLPSEADETDWTNLTLTLTGTESPEVGRVVEWINEEHDNSPPQTISEVCDLVQDLQVCPPTAPVEDPVTQSDCELPNLPLDEPVTTTSSPPTLYMETVAETGWLPLLLARRATATPIPARGVPNPPTAATKCPRKNHRMSEELRRKPKRPKAFSALREIRKLQEEVEPILPWLPFVRLVHELLFNRGPYGVQRQAIQALQVAAEAYIIEVLGGGNLPCMYRDQCTLAPKDIRLFRRLRGDVDSMGEALESEEARREDWRRYKKDHLTPGEAMVLDTNRHRKLRLLIQKTRQKLHQNLRR